MLWLLVASFVATVTANILCPVWRTAPDDAKGFALLGMLLHVAAIVAACKPRLRRWWHAASFGSGTQFIDRDERKEW